MGWKQRVRIGSAHERKRQRKWKKMNRLEGKTGNLGMVRGECGYEGASVYKKRLETEEHVRLTEVFAYKATADRKKIYTHRICICI